VLPVHEAFGTRSLSVARRNSVTCRPASIGETRWERVWLADGDGSDSIVGVTARESLPTDLAAAHALILAERSAPVETEASYGKSPTPHGRKSDI
jgi:hypothetical protein